MKRTLRRTPMQRNCGTPVPGGNAVFGHAPDFSKALTDLLFFDLSVGLWFLRSIVTFAAFEVFALAKPFCCL